MSRKSRFWVNLVATALAAGLWAGPELAKAQRRVTGLSVSVSPTGAGGTVDVIVDLNTVGGSETVRRLGPNFADGIKDFDTMESGSFYSAGNTYRRLYSLLGTNIDYQYTLLNPAVPGVEFGDGSNVSLPEVNRDSPGLLRGVFSHTYAGNQVVRVRVGAVTLLDDEPPMTLIDGDPIVLEPRTLGTNAYYTARGIFQGTATIRTVYSMRTNSMAPWMETSRSTMVITGAAPFTETESYTVLGSSMAVAVTDVTTVEICATSGACPNPCRNGATCNAGTVGCIGGTPTDCNDSITCTIDSCDPTVVGGCVSLNDDTVCATTDLCVQSAVCDPIDAGADPVTGCVNTPVVCVFDTVDCTLETCDSTFGCNPPDDSFCEDNNPCTADSCNTFSGCVNDGVGITVPCVTDTGGDMCLTGRCMGDADGTCAIVPKDCDDNNVCTMDSCNSATGCINDGTGITGFCSDNNECTLNDTCAGDAEGTCQGTPRTCDDLDPCTDDSCDPIGGCVFVNNGTCPSNNNTGNSNNNTTGRVGSGGCAQQGPSPLSGVALFALVSVVLRRRTKR